MQPPLAKSRPEFYPIQEYSLGFALLTGMSWPKARFAPRSWLGSGDFWRAEACRNVVGTNYARREQEQSRATTEGKEWWWNPVVSVGSLTFSAASYQTRSSAENRKKTTKMLSRWLGLDHQENLRCDRHPPRLNSV